MPSRATLNQIRRGAIVIWVGLLGTGLYLYFFQRHLVEEQLRGAFSASVFVAGAAYLLLGAIRGCTLLPSTTLVLAAIPFFRPWPLLGLTLVGILLSSAGIYYFSESLHLDEALARKHPLRVARLKAALDKYEMPIIIAWSFFPLAPTDLVCYVCGALGVDLKKCLLGSPWAKALSAPSISFLAGRPWPGCDNLTAGRA